jgi:hypothetical protein
MGRKRDFSEAAKEKLLQAIRQADQQQNFFWWVWDDLLDVISDQFIDGNISNYGEDIGKYHQEIVDKKNTTEDQLNKIWRNVYNAETTYISSMEVNHSDADFVGGKYKKLAAVLDPHSGYDGRVPLLNMTNAEVFSFYLDVLDGISDFKGKSDPYDKLGSYGGFQSGPSLHPELYKDIVAKYYPDLTIEKLLEMYPPDHHVWSENGGEICRADLIANPGEYSNQIYKYFLTGMNYEGCEYQALVNTIFSPFIGREAEFQEKFGFPMYVNGDFNFHALMVDFYCSSGTAGDGGLNATKAKRLLEKYLKDHGVQADVLTNVKVTPENFAELSKKGEIIIEASTILFDENGTLVDNRGIDNSSNRHAMVITGVTPEGYFMVSSWGKVYYVHPNDPRYKNTNYVLVEY